MPQVIQRAELQLLKQIKHKVETGMSSKRCILV